MKTLRKDNRLVRQSRKLPISIASPDPISQAELDKAISMCDRPVLTCEHQVARIVFFELRWVSLKRQVIRENKRRVMAYCAKTYESIEQVHGIVQSGSGWRLFEWEKWIQRLRSPRKTWKHAVVSYTFPDFCVHGNFARANFDDREILVLLMRWWLEWRSSWIWI